MLDPEDCGGEPLLAAATPGARRPSSSRQQSQKEVLRSRQAPGSAAISSRQAAAAAAAPRSPRLLPSRAPQPVPRCRLGSRGGRRRCSSPTRPGPRGPSRGRGDSGAPPSSPDASGCGDQRMRGAPSPGLSGRPERVRTSFSLGPGPLYRASEETKWPPGGNLGAQRVGAGIYVPAKNNSDPARLLLGPGAAPVGGGPPRRR